jgi:hypothetical protein
MATADKKRVKIRRRDGVEQHYNTGTATPTVRFKLPQKTAAAAPASKANYALSAAGKGAAGSAVVLGAATIAAPVTLPLAAIGVVGVAAYSGIQALRSSGTASAGQGWWKRRWTENKSSAGKRLSHEWHLVHSWAQERNQATQRARKAPVSRGAVKPAPSAGRAHPAVTKLNEQLHGPSAKASESPLDWKPREDVEHTTAFYNYQRKERAAAKAAAKVS